MNCFRFWKPLTKTLTNAIFIGLFWKTSRLYRYCKPLVMNWRKSKRNKMCFPLQNSMRWFIVKSTTSPRLLFMSGWVKDTVIFFIDEFQDTSEMQWQNLIPLIDNALSGQDDTGEKGNPNDCGRSKTIDLSLAWWKGRAIYRFKQREKP